MEKVIKVYEIEKKYNILGFNDDECVCGVCGREELKGTYIMEEVATGLVFRAGSTCGAKMAGWTTKFLVDEYKRSEKIRLDAARDEFRNCAENKAYNDCIDKLNDEDDRITARVLSCPDLNERKSIDSERRDMRSRMNIIKPFHDAREITRKEILLKYGFKEDRYIR